MSELYLYETKKTVGNTQIIGVLGLKTTKGRIILDHFAYILEWLTIAFLFWFDAQYVDSWIFQIFIFMCGFYIMQSIGMKRKLSSKEELQEKFNEILGVSNDH